MYTLWAEICAWLFKRLMNVCFSWLHIHFFTSTWKRLLHLFSIFDSMMFVPRPDRSVVLSRMLCLSPSRSSSSCLLSSLFFVILFFSYHSQITSPSPFRTGSHEQLDFFYIPGGVCCLPTDFLSVPRTSPRPSPTALFCFAPRFSWSSDRLSFVPHTSSRPSPAASFCFAPRFPLCSYRLSCVPRSSSRPSPTGSLLFSGAVPIVYTPTFPELYFFAFIFCLVRHFVSFCRLQSFVLSLAAFCCWPSSNNRMRMKLHVCLLSC